ncbi:uncharacterized protein LOC134196335 isoform X2 [Corticium candelabrum]|nr:uncharacterized protein LOC134196335 isoform X2 [Corticium candelabrum]
MRKAGCVKGFKYFAVYMRGREEMICKVINEPQRMSRSTSASLSGSFEMHGIDLPRNQQSFMISQRTQRRLSGYGFIDVGLPPASPSDREIDSADDNTTMFLIAGYSTYNCPYVWVRSNHERLVRLSGEDTTAKDNPLKLESTTKWNDQDIRVWDIIAELVAICTVPAPKDPFAVDLSYYDTLPVAESVLATGAMINFLQKVLDTGGHMCNSKILDDLNAVTQRHFEDMSKLLVEKNVAPASPSIGSHIGTRVHSQSAD